MYKSQVGGRHYLDLPIQPWQIIDANGLDFYQGTALAYIIRNKGNRIQDIKKAIHTLEHYVEVLESKPPHPPPAESIPLANPPGRSRPGE